MAAEGARRRPFAALAALALLAGTPSPAPPADGYEPVRRMLSDSRRERRQAAAELAAAADPALVPALVDALFFTPRRQRAELVGLLRELTGEERKDYYEWVEYVAGRPEPEPPPGYAEWKRSLLVRIDPAYARVLYPGAPARIRLEEVVWGGVRLDGIPALDRPPVVAAAEADFMRPEERVFGVRLGGVARAYPLRVLSWHEMLNDEVGGTPVALSFCTLCGSGILYATASPAGEPYRLGTSGLLYRSNKLMFDSHSYTLWSNLTGEPVVGRLAATAVRLEMLPMTLTTWAEWRRRHPDTGVLDLAWVRERFGDRLGFDYRPGAADRRRRGVAFPVWPRSEALAGDAEVFTLRAAAAARAWPVEGLLRAGVVNDTVGELAVVLVADSDSGAIRAYERGDRSFAAAGEVGRLLDGAGGEWLVAEEALRPAGSGAAAAALPRVPGHLARWFGWYAFYPRTTLWALPEE